MKNVNTHKIEHVPGCRCGCGASFDYSQLEKLSNAQLFIIDGFITPRILRVIKANPVAKINAIEISLADAMTADFGIHSQRAINRAIKVLKAEGKTGKWTQTKIDKILQPIADAIGPRFAQGQANRILQAAIGIYNTQKTFESQRAGIKPSFNVVDDVAKRGIAQNNLFWVGRRYGTDIGPRLRGIVNDILITQGLPLNEAADAMARAMGYVIDKKAGDKMPPLADPAKIPKGFTGTPRDYFRGVAAAIRTTSTSFASIQTFQEVGFNWYVLSNPMDSQTTELCAFLNGKVYRTGDGARVMNNYMGASTPTDAKAAMPWMTFNELGRRAGFESAGDYEQKGLTTAALASADVALPPFHFRCRTVAEPIGGTGMPGAPPAPPPGAIQKPPPGIVQPPPTKPPPPSAKPKKVPTKPPKTKKPKPPPAPDYESDYTPRNAPDISKTFKPATTLKEAEKRIRERFGQVIYRDDAKGWSSKKKLERLNGILYELDRVRANGGMYDGYRYSQFIVEDLVKSNNAAGMHSWWGWKYSEGSSKLYMDGGPYSANKNWSPMDIAAEKRITDMKKRSSWEQRHTVSSFSKHHTCTMRHELAHGVHYMADAHSNGATAKMREDVYIRLGGSSSSKLPAYISKYSKKNPLEMFAELFTVYTSPEFRVGSIDEVLGVGTEQMLQAHIYHAGQRAQTQKGTMK